MKGEIKIVITGPVGAGKTTAISALAGDGAISTDMAASDEVRAAKRTTTVAMDYAELDLDEGERLRLYGTPGQERFRYMWEILAEGALGFVILVDATRADPVADMEIYLDNFGEHIRQSGAVVGVTKGESGDEELLISLTDRLARRGAAWPVLPLDPRRRTDVAVVLDALMAILEFDSRPATTKREVS